METGRSPRSDAPRAEQRSWWSSVKEALAGSEQDYTEGPLGRAVLLLAVPMVLEMAMESLFGILDVFWVARLGAGAVATVGVTEAMLTLVFAVALGLSLSTTATVARRIGEKDPESAAVTGPRKWARTTPMASATSTSGTASMP